MFQTGVNVPTGTERKSVFSVGVPERQDLNRGHKAAGKTSDEMLLRNTHKPLGSLNVRNNLTQLLTFYFSQTHETEQKESDTKVGKKVSKSQLFQRETTKREHVAETHADRLINNWYTKYLCSFGINDHIQEGFLEKK